MAAITAALAGLASPALAQEANDQEFAALVAETSTEQVIATAEQQTAGGDLLGAAATLERALLENPNAHDVRLKYAATLCRLGDAQGARIEVTKLDRQAISDAAWNDAERACGGALARPAAAAGRSDGGISGEAYAGLAYDSDAAGALLLQFDFGPGTVEKDDGLAVIAGLRLGFRAEGTGPYVSVTALGKHDISGPELDYDIGEARAGLGGGEGTIGWAVGGVLRRIRLLGERYVTEAGGQGELTFGRAGARRIRVRGEVIRQNYHFQPFVRDPDGMHYDLSATLESPFGRGFFAVGVAAEAKSAEDRELAYRAGRLFGVVQLPAFASGHYANLSGTFRYIDFRHHRFFEDRKDKRLFVRAAYGLPLVSKLHLEGAASYTLRSTDFSGPFAFIDPVTYRSVGAETRLVWKF
jgi:hypothetical protein